MTAYIFVVHHKCSYVDGMAVIVAKTYEEAAKIFEKTKGKDVLRRFETEHYSSFEEDFIIDEGDKILNHYPEDIPERFYGNIWCLYTTIEMAIFTKPGLIAFAYHDG